MTRLYRFTGFFTLLLTLLCTGVRAQTTVAQMDFDGTAPEMGIMGSIAFYDGGATAFFGIHNANADDTDGSPTDTGVGATNRTTNVDDAPISGDFFFVVDNNTTQNPTNFSTITLGPVNVSGQSDLLFSFDYNAFDFDGGEDISYQLDIDGNLTDPVEFVDGANGTADVNMAGSLSIPVPDNTNSVRLIITINQNANDYVAFDNFLVTANNPGLPCGVTSFGPELIACITESAAINTDLFRIEIPYSGLDADATLLVEAGPTSPSNDVTATTTNTGDDFTSTPNGTIILENSAGEFEEGDEIRVTLTDGGGGCSYVLNISTAQNECSNPCNFSVDPNDLRLFCVQFSANNNADQVGGTLDFSGSELGVTAMISGSPGFPMIISGDPATDDDGEIAFGGLVEGGSYTITFSGGVCPTTTIPFSVPADLCTPSDLIINEILADPAPTDDANGDGVFSSGEDEFVELYNVGATDLDVSGYVLEEGAGARYEFPANTIIPAGTGFVIFSGGTPTNLPCQTAIANLTPFLSLNNDADAIIIRNASGSIVSQYLYTNGPSDQSLALNPDFNLNESYAPHTTITSNPVTSSPCFENTVPSVPLPVDLLSFDASASGKTVRLNWETAAEINNDHFLVQRLTSVSNWATLGNVPAMNGRSNAYEFTDETPRQGDNIYRLQQVDLDGSTELHGPINVTFTKDELNVWPNPAGNEIRFGSSLTANSRITLLNANGRLLRELPVGSDRADLSDLPGGIYLLRVARASGTEVVRFVKK